MSDKGNGPRNEEATKTLVGARPIRMLESERLSETLPAVSSKVEAPVKDPAVPSAEPTPIPLRRVEEWTAAAPEPPRTIEATGLPQQFLEDLCLKHLFLAGELRGGEVSRRTCLPPVVTEELMERLRKGRLVDIKGTRGVGIARTQTVFALTEAGLTQGEMALERDRYVGPSPVPFVDYCAAVSAQSIRGNRFSRGDLEPSFQDLVLGEEVYDALGPAMNSGRSLFLYGPSGNGKTVLCHRLTRCLGGEIFVPHAVMIDGVVITVFDEVIHVKVPARDDEELWDERWVRCERPMVVVGGDLTLEDLELRYCDSRRYYEAPFQLKANGGVLLIDDFGRQRIAPKVLLNRWIVPLESDVDYLAVHTGKKLRVPFDVFIIFSTNLEPSSLADEAFLRRVRYKIQIQRPTAARYVEIFQREAAQRGVRTSQPLIDYLVRTHYQVAKRPFNACEPRDLLEQVIDVCTFRGIEPVLSKEIIDRVVANYFVKLA